MQYSLRAPTRILLFLSGIAIALALAYFVGQKPWGFRSGGLSLVPTLAAAAPIDAASPQELANRLRSANLPISQVIVRETPNATGTVIYIPQVHLSPGSNPADPQNDEAEATQGQIGSIVKYLTGAAGDRFVMMEGNNYGPVPSDMLDVVAQKMQARDALSQAAAQTGNSCNAGPCAMAAQGAQALIRQLDREIALAGGALDAKAAGGDFALYGAEDPDLQAKAGDIVRNWYYLGDRIASLTGQAPSMDAIPSTPAQPQVPQLASKFNLPMNSPLSSLLSMLMQNAQPQMLSDATVQNLSAFGAQTGNTAASQDAEALGSALAQARAAEAAGQAQTAQAAQGLPSRSDNPYASDMNVADLQTKLTQAQGDMQSTIVDARNAMASAHFAQGLAEVGTKTGALIYGAGHTAGLISDLQAKGLSVIVVVPQTLGSDPELNAALGS